MESSSENSFAWTDTSSDSINSTSMAADNINDGSIESFTANDGKKTKGKKSRKKNNDESVSSEPNVVIKEEKAYYESKSNSSLKNKIIKIEPNSDNDAPKKRKKIKNIVTNGDHDSQDSMSYDETYLNLKVKQEKSPASSFTKEKKKKHTSSKDSSKTPLKNHENNSSSEINDDNVTFKEETENDTEMSKPKKKKKKSKKHYDSDNLHLDIEEQMDIEKTVVNKNSKGNNSSSEINDDVTFKEETENDTEMSKTKKKKKKKSKIHYDSDNLHLDIEEQMDIEKTVVNKNSKCNNSSSEINDDNVTFKEETENDTEMSKPKKKKKSKKHYDSDNLHLDIEEKMDIEKTVVNKNSIGNNSSSEINDDNVTFKEETENDTEMSKPKKKKKKKSKKHYDSDNLHLDIEEQMDIEKTVVNKNSKCNHTHSFVTENTTLQEESEESSCDEISAIKCDDSHSPHTVSFINKSIEDDNTKLNCSDITKLTHSVPEQDFNEKLEATEHRKQRISDRIRFEDDDDDTNTESSRVEHESHSENNKKPLKLKHFLKTNPNLKLLRQTFNNNTNLTRDDEIWILKCPKEINIKDFNNTNLNIHGKCKIKVGGQTYEGSAAEEQSDNIAVLIMEQNKYKIRNVPLSGVINLRKRIPKAHFRDDNIMVNNQTNFIPLPETKCRHPLFGSNYKKALKIPAAIAERLNVLNTEDTIMRTAKGKKKKNKKERNTSQQVDPQVQSDVTMKTEPELSVVIREKKIKKRKMIDDEGSAPKKVKRIKHDPESAEAWESEQAIEENLFNF